MIRDWGEKRTTLGLSYMPTLFPGFLSLSPSKKYFCEEGRCREGGSGRGPDIQMKKLRPKHVAVANA